MIDRTLSAFVAVSLSLLIWLYARSRDQEVLVTMHLLPDARNSKVFVSGMAGSEAVLQTFKLPPRAPPADRPGAPAAPPVTSPPPAGSYG